MRIIIVVLISLITLCSCTSIGNNDISLQVPEENSSVNLPEPLPAESPVPEEELPYSFLTSPDFDRQNGATVLDYDIAFDLGELLQEEYPSGEWSVDELEEKYGEANEVRGSLEPTRYIIISLTWDDMSVYIRAPRDGTMSFDIDTNSAYEFYPVTTEDRAIQIPIDITHIYSESIPLPRGLKIGQSTIEDVEAAYPPIERIEMLTYIHALGFWYFDFNKVAKKQRIEKSDMGSVVYYFVDDILQGVEIGWPSELP